MQNCEVVQPCLKGVSTDLNFYLTAYVVPVKLPTSITLTYRG